MAIDVIRRTPNSPEVYSKDTAGRSIAEKAAAVRLSDTRTNSLRTNCIAWPPRDCFSTAASLNYTRPVVTERRRLGDRKRSFSRPSLVAHCSPKSSVDHRLKKTFFGCTRSLNVFSRDLRDFSKDRGERDLFGIRFAKWATLLSKNRSDQSPPQYSQRNGRKPSIFMEATTTSKFPSASEQQKQTTPQLLPVTPVGILAEKLQRLHASISQSGIEADALAELAECSELASGLDQYVSLCTTPESDALQNLAEQTAQEDWSERFCDGETVHELEREMLSGHAEGQLLKFLVGMSNARTVLEIGMFTGYSALAMAEQLLEGQPNGDSGPPPKLVACELDPYTADFAKKTFCSIASRQINRRASWPGTRNAAAAGEQWRPV